MKTTQDEFRFLSRICRKNKLNIDPIKIGVILRSCKMDHLRAMDFILNRI